MCSKKHHLQFLWPYLMTREKLDRTLFGKSCNGDTGIWSHDTNKCLLFSFYKAREAQAEIKILNLLMHSPRETGGIETVPVERREPSDAEIIFGNCDCEKLLCNRGPCRTGWDRSRIDWLWDLEHLERQDELRYVWREQGMRKQFSKRSPVPSVINLIRSAEVQPTNVGCWSWLRHSCGYVSDTDSLDVGKSAISL